MRACYLQQEKIKCDKEKLVIEQVSAHEIIPFGGNYDTRKLWV